MGPRFRRRTRRIERKQQIKNQQIRRRGSTCSRNPATNIVSLPWCGGSTRRTGPIDDADHRTGGARHRGRRLRVLLLHHVDGYIPQAIYQRHHRFQGADEHVRQRARIPAGRFQRRGALQLRYAVFRLLARHDQSGRHLARTPMEGITCCRCSTCGRTSSHRRAGGTRVPRPGHSWWRRRAGGRICAKGSLRSSAAKGHPTDRRADTLCLADRPDQDRRSAGLPCSSQDPGRLQGHPAFRVWQNAQAGRIQARPKRRHEDAAKNSGRYDDGWGVFRPNPAELLKLHPPHITDEPILAQMKKIGIEPGKSFDIGKLDPAGAKGAGNRTAGRTEADGLEGADAGAGCQRLGDEH